MFYSKLAFEIKPLAQAVFLLSLSPMAVSAISNDALPTQGQVSQGNAQISHAPNSANMTITQQSQQAAINWHSFNIGKDASVSFVQPNAQSAILNRVAVGSSEIAGSISANGQVYLLNPNGVIYSPTAQVNVGALVTSTGHITDDDWQNPQKNIVVDQKNHASIINLGRLKSAQGDVVLHAKQVINDGDIVVENSKVVSSTPAGTAKLLAGTTLRVNVTRDGLIQSELETTDVTKQFDGAHVSNTGTISTNSGDVTLQSLGNNSHTNHSGDITAHSTAEHKSTVLVLAGKNKQEGLGTTIVTGSIDASAPISGDGGFVETSAAKVGFGDTTKITTMSTNGNVGTWLIDPTDFTISEGSAALSTNGIGNVTLQNNLSTSNVVLETQASGSEKGDINVNAPVTWDENLLTLKAHNDIHINKPIQVTDTGQLALEYGQSSPTGGDSDYYINAPVDIPTGNNFSTQKGSNTANKINYFVITELGDETSAYPFELQGIKDSPFGNYALGKDIDATATSTWNSGKGFSPIDADSGTIKLDGLGHSIKGLVINRATEDNVGFISKAAGDSQLRNLTFEGGSIVGKNNVGVIAAVNSGTVSVNNVTNNMDNVTGASYLGGIVGRSVTTNKISIKASNNSAKIISTGNYAGGISGEAENIKISTTYNTGDIKGVDYVGGIAGAISTDSEVSEVYNTGAVTGAENTGGLFGFSAGKVENAYNTGDVTGTNNVGGIVGKNAEFPVDSYFGEIIFTYNTGKVTGTSKVGGLVGFSESTKKAQTSYYDKTKNPTSPEGVGKTLAELKQASTYGSSAIDKVGGQSTTWRIYEGNTTPLLKTFLTKAIVNTKDDTTKHVYNSTKQSSTGGISSTTPSFDVNKVFGQPTSEGEDAGTHNISISSLYSNQQGYDIIQGTKGKMTIDQKPMTIEGITASNKTYDGTTEAVVDSSKVQYTGLIAGDDVKIKNVIGQFDDKNVGNNKVVTLTKTFEGTDLNNYAVNRQSSTNANITPRNMSIQGITAKDKKFDNTTSATVDSSKVQYTGLIAGDDVQIKNVAGQFADKNVGSNKTVNLTSTYSGVDKNNYKITDQKTTTASITPLASNPIPTPTPIIPEPEPTPEPTPVVEPVPAPTPEPTPVKIETPPVTNPEATPEQPERKLEDLQVIGQIQSRTIDSSILDRSNPFAVANDALDKFETLDDCDDNNNSQTQKYCIKKPVTTEANLAEDDNSQAVPIQKKYALVIGNSSYQNVTSLGGAKNDSSAVSRLLKTKGYEVLQVNDATKADMVNSLNNLVTNTNLHDSVMIYYAGHGYIHQKTQEGYWIPVDAQVTNPKKWLANRDIVRFLKNIPAKQIMLVSDSCFSGSFTYEGAQHQNKLGDNAVLKRRSAVVISSGDIEVVKDKVKQYSPFATEFMEILDQKDQKQIRASELSKKIAVKMAGYYQQKPQYGTLYSAGHMDGGDYILSLK